MGTGIILAAISVFVLAPPVSLRCANGSVPEQIDLFASNFATGGRSGHVMVADDSLSVVPGSSGSRPLSRSELEELLRSIEHAQPLPWAAGEYRATLVVDMTCDGQRLPTQEAHAERPARPFSLGDLLAPDSWQRLTEAVGALDPRRRRILAMTHAVLELAHHDS